MASIDIKEALTAYEEEPITRQMMTSLLMDYKRPNDKVSEMLASGTLLQLKRGLYQPGPGLKIRGPHPFLVANILYGPSYVSMESALSYWGMIPERVYETSAVTTGRGRRYDTKAGVFSYTRMSLPYYALGIRRVTLSERQAILIASPEKALCDKIVTTAGLLLRSEKQTRELLLDDLRISPEWLGKLAPETIRRWIQHAPKQSSLQILTDTLENRRL